MRDCWPRKDSSGGQEDTGLILPDKMGDVNITVSLETRMKWQHFTSEKWNETVMAIRQLKGLAAAILR